MGNIKLLSIKFLTLFILILVSDDSLYFGTNIQGNIFYLKILILASIVIGLIFYFLFNDINFKRKHVMFLLLLICFFIITAITNNDMMKFAYYYRIFYMLLAFLLTYFINLNEFKILFEKLILFLSGFSIITFLIEISSLTFYYSAPIVTNISNNSFYNMLFSNIKVQNWGVARNYGLFREPGVFQVFIIIAVIIHLFSREKKSLYSLTIYVVALLTTRSTTGYIGIVAVICLFIISESKDKRELFTKGFVMISFILGITYLLTQTNILFDSTGYGSVFGKLFNDFEAGSGSARIGSIYSNVYMFFQNPITGIGMTGIEIEHPKLMAKMYNVASEHNTNHLLLPFSTFGFFYGTIWTYGYYNFSKNINNNKLISLGIFVVFIIIFTGSSLPNNVIMMSLVFYGYFNSNSATEQINDVLL